MESLDASAHLVHEIVRKRLGQGLDDCDVDEATQMAAHSPLTTRDYNNFDQMAGKRERLFVNAHGILDPTCRRAPDLGVMLVMKSIEDIVPADRKLLCQGSGSPALQLLVDTGHARSAYGSNGAPPMGYFI